MIKWLKQLFCRHIGICIETKKISLENEYSYDSFRSYKDEWLTNANRMRCLKCGKEYWQQSTKFIGRKYL